MNSRYIENQAIKEHYYKNQIQDILKKKHGNTEFKIKQNYIAISNLHISPKNKGDEKETGDENNYFTDMDLVLYLKSIEKTIENSKTILLGNIFECFEESDKSVNDSTMFNKFNQIYNERKSLVDFIVNKVELRNDIIFINGNHDQILSDVSTNTANLTKEQLSTETIKTIKKLNVKNSTVLEIGNKTLYVAHGHESNVFAKNNSIVKCDHVFSWLDGKRQRFSHKIKKHLKTIDPDIFDIVQSKKTLNEKKEQINKIIDYSLDIANTAMETIPELATVSNVLTTVKKVLDTVDDFVDPLINIMESKSLVGFITKFKDVLDSGSDDERSSLSESDNEIGLVDLVSDDVSDKKKCEKIISVIYQVNKIMTNMVLIYALKLSKKYNGVVFGHLGEETNDIYKKEEMVKTFKSFCFCQSPTMKSQKFTYTNVGEWVDRKRGSNVTETRIVHYKYKRPTLDVHNEIVLGSYVWEHDYIIHQYSRRMPDPLNDSDLLIGIDNAFFLDKMLSDKEYSPSETETKKTLKEIKLDKVLTVISKIMKADTINELLALKDQPDQKDNDTMIKMRILYLTNLSKFKVMNDIIKKSTKTINFKYQQSYLIRAYVNRKLDSFPHDDEFWVKLNELVFNSINKVYKDIQNNQSKVSNDFQYYKVFANNFLTSLYLLKNESNII